MCNSAFHISFNVKIVLKWKLILKNLFFYLGDIWTFEFLKSTLSLKKKLLAPITYVMPDNISLESCIPAQFQLQYG